MPPLQQLLQRLTRSEPPRTKGPVVAKPDQAVRSPLAAVLAVVAAVAAVAVGREQQQRMEKRQSAARSTPTQDCGAAPLKQVACSGKQGAFERSMARKAGVCALKS
jgi:hypothetical protein